MSRTVGRSVKFSGDELVVTVGLGLFDLIAEKNPRARMLIAEHPSAALPKEAVAAFGSDLVNVARARGLAPGADGAAIELQVGLGIDHHVGGAAQHLGEARNARASPGGIEPADPARTTYVQLEP
mgnify:CR=1 FL=1